MFKELKKISLHMVIYGLGGILTRALGFLLLPVYTHYIIPNEYGVMALIDLTGYVVGILVTGQISIVLLRFYYDCQNESEKKSLIFTAFVMMAISGIAILGCLEYFAPRISDILVDNKKHTILFQLMFITLFFNSFYDIFLAYLRANEKSKLFALLQITNTLLSLTLNIYFIAFLKLSILGMFLSNAIVTIVFSIFSSIWLLKQSNYLISSHFIKKMILFSLPMIPTTVFIYFLHYSDRYFLKIYSSLAVVGVYSVAYKFGSIIGLLINQPFRLMWSAKLFELAKMKEGKEIQKRVLTYLMFIICFAFIIVCVPIKEIVYIFTQEKYHAAHEIVPIIALGYMFFGLNWVFRGGLLIMNKTVMDSVVAGVTALINALLNAVLVKRYGAVGAAYATMLSYFLYTFFLFIISIKYYPIKYEFSRLLKIIIATGIIYALSTIVDAPIYQAILIKGLIISSFPVILYLFKFFEANEKSKFIKAIKAVRV